MFVAGLYRDEVLFGDAILYTPVIRTGVFIITLLNSS